MGDRMRTLAVGLIGLICALTASASAAPPPPPPPPPPELQGELDGYRLAPIWSSYNRWVVARIGEARAIALEQRPARFSRDHFRADIGPQVHVYSNEPGGEMSGYNMRLERWCEYGEGQVGACTWIARSVHNRYSPADEFARTHFDPVRAVAFLREAAVAPDAIDERMPRSFGLTDPLAYGGERYVEVNEVVESECAAVGASIALVEEVRAQLSVTHERPSTGSSPPPPWPHAGIFEVTLPGWYVQRRDDPILSGAELTLYGSPDSMASRVRELIFAPIRACPQMQSR